MDSLLLLLRDIEKALDKSDFYGGIISNVFVSRVQKYDLENRITKCFICIRIRQINK